ncbi:oxidoreductase, short chain dehydrogenase/reductase family protein [Teladorsagia circumcincta]|uniref:Oxidoreductase, short chain dehydrogenase/reductase family protein n=1 Tax=Teladorsagia circumcincta TaxID=45464 RepID=A0A2G9UUK3_TELCI|nr:oxidoreductase, short chain dehydrogenase/reductase family protein [Teladorsagia circumcincta]
MVCDCLVVSAGYCILAVIAYKIISAVYNVLYPYLIGAPVDLHSMAGAKWAEIIKIAVVTGATDGIGKAYAYELARKGFNIYLVSRTQSKLDEVEKDLSQKYNKISVKTFAFDFSVGSVDEYKPLLEALDKVDIGILVNNVGMSFEYPEILHETDGGLQRIGGITTINTLPVTILSAHVLKQMTPRKKGVIVNVSSFASYNPMALWAVYSATKASGLIMKYVSWLSEILRMEYANKGITVQTICPMTVATKMSKVRRTSFFVPNGETFARSAVRSIGLTDDTTGCLSHQIQAEASKLAPPIILNKIIINFSMSLRQAALRKKAKSQ